MLRVVFQARLIYTILSLSSFLSSSALAVRTSASVPAFFCPRHRGLFRRFLPRYSSRILMSTAHDNHDNTPTSTTMNTDNPLERLGLPHPLLLGSASFTRKLILKELGVPFLKIVRPIDENAVGDRLQDSPKDLVLTIAQAKMNHLLTELQNGKISAEELPGEEFLILTGDQVVTCQGHILEKPESIEQARDFCKMYQTHPPSTVGSCILAHWPSGIQVAGVDTATIYFHKTIPTTLIDALVEQGEPILSCAGGLMIEHPLTKEHLERIDGTEDSVMGLSKDLVLRLLQELKENLVEWKGAQTE